MACRWNLQRGVTWKWDVCIKRGTAGLAHIPTCHKTAARWKLPAQGTLTAPETPRALDRQAARQPRDKLLLVDGHCLAFRAYYSMVNARSEGLATSTGIPTTICHGFLQMLLSVVKRERPQALVIAFDFGGSSIRRQLDPSYKSSREAAPSNVSPDLENLREFIRALGIKEAWHEGYEGDDILATLSMYGAEQGYDVQILTNDLDLLQAVDDEGGISVLLLLSGSVARRGFAYREVRSEQVVERLGVLPMQVPDLKGLQGDSSDDIPGVRGIGPKTAAKLLAAWGTLEALYDNLDQLSAAQRRKLEEGRGSAFLSRQLATVMRDAPVGQLRDLSCARMQGVDVASFSQQLHTLELHQLLARLDEFQAAFAQQQARQPRSTMVHTGGQQL